MHFSAVHSTMPLSGSLGPAWNGQPAAHAGSRQCMHCRFTNENADPSSGLYSLITLRVRSFKSDGDWCKLSPRGAGGVSLASAQPATHALQPMHLVAS